MGFIKTDDENYHKLIDNSKSAELSLLESKILEDNTDLELSLYNCIRDAVIEMFPKLENPSIKINVDGKNLDCNTVTVDYAGAVALKLMPGIKEYVNTKVNYIIQSSIMIDPVTGTITVATNNGDNQVGNTKTTSSSNNSGSNSDKSVTELEKKINLANTEISSLKNQSDFLTSEAKYLREYADVAKLNFAYLSEAVKNIADSIEQTTSAIAGTEKPKEDESNVVGILSGLTLNADTINTIQGDIITIQSGLETIQSGQTNIQSNIDTIQTNYNTLQNDYLNLQQTYNELYNAHNALETEFTTQLGNLNQSITNLQHQINDLNNNNGGGGNGPNTPTPDISGDELHET